ncbi:hypothetical protein HDU93_007584, partial [Gonapodya sp. JEL0774]
MSAHLETAEDSPYGDGGDSVVMPSRNLSEWSQSKTWTPSSRRLTEAPGPSSTTSGGINGRSPSSRNPDAMWPGRVEFYSGSIGTGKLSGVTGDLRSRAVYAWDEVRQPKHRRKILVAVVALALTLIVGLAAGIPASRRSQVDVVASSGVDINMELARSAVFNELAPASKAPAAQAAQVTQGTSAPAVAGSTSMRPQTTVSGAASLIAATTVPAVVTTTVSTTMVPITTTTTAPPPPPPASIGYYSGQLSFTGPQTWYGRIPVPSGKVLMGAWLDMSGYGDSPQRYASRIGRNLLLFGDFFAFPLNGAWYGTAPFWKQQLGRGAVFVMT